MTNNKVFKKTYAIIVAAGSGSRMGTKTPKQLLPYGGQTILEASVRRFAECDSVDDVIVVSPSDGSLDEIYQSLLGAIDPDIKIVRGGTERADSVYAGLMAAAQDAETKGLGADDADADRKSVV